MVRFVCQRCDYSSTLTEFGQYHRRDCARPYEVHGRTDGRTDGGRASGVPFQLGAVPIHGNGKPDVSDFAMRQTEGETLCCLHGRRPAIRKGGSDSSFRNWVRKSETGRPATE